MYNGKKHRVRWVNVCGGHAEAQSEDGALCVYSLSFTYGEKL